ncbi:hypothetical protein G6F57_013154 [Rhizopus arrhizus]|nr:hypothetical protein G6F57_013154 [Rhizopus arrhizus]
MGRLKASMPMKCIDQMPRPMAKPPPSRHHQAAPLPGAVTVRPAIASAVYEAITATSNEIATSHGLYVPTSIRQSPGPSCRRKPRWGMHEAGRRGTLADRGVPPGHHAFTLTRRPGGRASSKA